MAESCLQSAYRQAGVAPGRLVYVTVSDGIDAAPHLRAIRAVMGVDGTLAASAATRGLIGTSSPFDPRTSCPDDPAGAALFEMADARRSVHPFESYVAVGPLAARLMDDTGPHALGPETPAGRLLAYDALCVVVGLPPHVARLPARLAEFAMAVPYRYVRETVHPVRRDGVVAEEVFYLHVPYRGMGLAFDDGAALFAHVRAAGLELGAGRADDMQITAYSIASFYRLACRALRHDLYIGCLAAPTERPYRF